MPKPAGNRDERSLEIAGVVHDVNQMLTAIAGRVSLLEAGGGGAGDLQAISLAVVDAGVMLRRLHGERPVDGPVSLRVCVDEVARLIPTPDRRPWSAGSSWSFVNDVPVPVWTTVPGQVVREVLCNLVVNALDAMPAGGTVRIAAAAHDGRVRLTVSDEGPGLAPGAAEHIFEAGFTTRFGSGRGIGLAASRHLLSACGGLLTAAEPADSGAVFRLDLPAAAPVVPSAPTAADLPSTVGSVLVVDDEISVREVLADLLESWGIARVTVRGDAAASRADFTPGAHELALVDLTLPGESGLELAAWLRARDPDLSIVMMTGLDRAGALADVDETVVDATVDKPLDFASLRRLLPEAVARRRRVCDLKRGTKE